MIQLTLTLKQVVETSVTVNNSPIQDYVHPDDHTQPTYEMTRGLKPFTEELFSNKKQNGSFTLTKTLATLLRGYADYFCDITVSDNAHEF